jgi:hypothetical protein
MMRETLKLKESCEQYVQEAESRNASELQRVHSEGKRSQAINAERERAILNELLALREDVEMLRGNHQEKLEQFEKEVDSLRNSQGPKENRFLENRNASNLLKTYEENIALLKEEITTLGYGTDLEREKFSRTLALKEQSISKLNSFVQNQKLEIQRKAEDLSKAKMEISRLEVINKELSFEIELVKRNEHKRHHLEPPQALLEDNEVDVLIKQYTDIQKTKEPEDDRAEVLFYKGSGKKKIKKIGTAGLLEKLKNLKNLQSSLDYPGGRSTARSNSSLQSGDAGTGYSPLKSNRSAKGY